MGGKLHPEYTTSKQKRGESNGSPRVFTSPQASASRDGKPILCDYSE
jgi:hypothetical protein